MDVDSHSRRNADVVRAVYDAWARGELPGPAGLLDDQIEYVNPAGAIEPGTRRGLNAFAGAVAKTLEGWESWQMEPREFRTSGDQVAVEVRYRARGRRSGLDVEGYESALWSVENGKVTRYEWFHGPRDAFLAIGAR